MEKLILYCYLSIIVYLFVGNYTFESVDICILIENMKKHSKNVLNQYKPEIMKLFNLRFLCITLKTLVLWCASDVGLYLTTYAIPQIIL